VAKKRTPTRKKSTARKTAKKPARSTRASATKRTRASAGGVDFNPVKKQLRAHIARLERKLATAEARAAVVDPGAFESLNQLKALNDQLTTMCFPSMVIPNT
jgi:uncharacterized protein involved in exopolysaccharide biosynthesis